MNRCIVSKSVAGYSKKFRAKYSSGEMNVDLDALRTQASAVLLGGYGSEVCVSAAYSESEAEMGMGKALVLLLALS